jgi:hypothetical protein
VKPSLNSRAAAISHRFSYGSYEALNG